MEKRQRDGYSLRHELVTITVREEDYAKLKAGGVPYKDYVFSALSGYMETVQERELPSELCPGWQRGRVINFPCAVPKDLCEAIRQLTGRFDTHTIEAVRLFLR